MKYFKHIITRGGYKKTAWSIDPVYIVDTKSQKIIPKYIKYNA